MFLLILTFTIVSRWPFVHGASLSTMQRLKQDVLHGYDNKLRPVYNQSQRIDVNVQYNIVGILELEEVTEKFSFTGYLSMQWTDEAIRWDPSEYENIEWLLLPVDDVWLPSLVLVTPYEKAENIQNSWDMVRYYYNGTAAYTTGNILNVKCPMDTTFYPWDIQTCFVFFSPVGYSPEEVMLISVLKNVTRKYYLGNGQWELIESNTNSGISDLFPAFVLKFTLERKPTFLIVNIILPVAFMSVLNILVFFLPVESGERVTYAITVLLSIAVFLTLVGDNLPKHSTPMPILSYYLLGVLCLSVLICVFTIVNLHVYFMDTLMPIPRYLQIVTACCLCCKMREIRRDASPVFNRQLNTNKYDDEKEVANDMEYRNGTKRRTKISMNNSKSKKTIQLDKDENTENNITWQDVSIAGDKICFIISFLCFLAGTVIFVGVMTQRDKGMSEHNSYIDIDEIQWI